VKQRLTAEVTSDVTGFIESGFGRFDIVQGREELGAVEQAVGEVVGRAEFAQAGDGRGEDSRGVRVVGTGGKAGAG